MKKLYAIVKNEFDEDVVIPFCELECTIENIDDIGVKDFAVKFVRLTDEEYEQLPDFEG